MNTAAQVDAMVANWKAEGRSKAEIVWLSAEACLGWPYAWGSSGQECTVSARKTCMGRSKIADGDRELIRKRCLVLSGAQATCDGCKYKGTLLDDCRWFTRLTLQRVGVTIQGGGATSQWKTASNWVERGLIKDMPKDKICCVFQDVDGTKEHTGLALGDEIIHCSVEVKRGHTYDKGWTHYAVPKGVTGDVPVPEPSFPTIKRGSRGQYVTLAQTKLIQQGYSVGAKGADGIFGAATEAAVRSFQADHGLKVDGIIGPASWAALNDGKTAYYTVTIRHVGKAVAEGIVKQYGGTMTAEED